MSDSNCRNDHSPALRYTIRPAAESGLYAVVDTRTGSPCFHADALSRDKAARIAEGYNRAYEGWTLVST